MPNWVFNGLHIQDSPEKIYDIMALVAKPYESCHCRTRWDQETKSFIVDNTPVVEEALFSFWNIKKPDDLESYYTVADSSTMNIGGNWYNWNILNWGTKWDACEVEIISRDAEGVTYRFDTAWSPPLPVIKELSRQFPSAKITLEYQEENGWGGEYTFAGGEVVDSLEYDSPPCEEESKEEEVSRQA